MATNDPPLPALWTGLYRAGRHRSVGGRAWCQCQTWCYPHSPCWCCLERQLDEQGDAQIPDIDLDRIEARCDQIEAQLETLKATVALLLLDNNMPIKAKQVRDL